jgi:hypothetical protein
VRRLNDWHKEASPVAKPARACFPYLRTQDIGLNVHVIKLASSMGVGAPTRRVAMERSDLLSPWRVLLGLLPLVYAGLLMIELQNTWVWLGVLAALLVLLLFLATSFDYPLLACWPAFSSTLLLMTCGIMLYQGIPDVGIVPVTRSPLELWGVAVLAGVALIWVVLSTRQMKERI